MSFSIKKASHYWPIYFFIPLLSLPIWLQSCGNDGSKDIREFYFPYDMLEEGLVYEYKAVNNDSLAPEFWFYKSLKTDSALFLTGTNYNHVFEVQQFFREEIVKNGSLTRDYFLYGADSTGNIQRFDAEILSDNAFPFVVRDSMGIFLMKLKWVFSTEPVHTTTLIRNRRYMGEDSYSYKGKMHECVLFENKELIDDERDGHLEQQYLGVEHYAKNIGLIHYRKEIGDEFVLEYELVDIFSMEELERRFQEEQ